MAVLQGLQAVPPRAWDTDVRMSRPSLLPVTRALSHIRARTHALTRTHSCTLCSHGLRAAVSFIHGFTFCSFSPTVNHGLKILNGKF